MKKFDDKTINEILSKYDTGVPITTLNKLFHTTKVRNILIENGRSVPERRPGQGGAKRKTTLDENYFETIDSKDKAYFLGFIYADGFITKRDCGQNLLGITLAEIEPLEKFKKYIQSDKKIGTYKKVNSYSDKSIEYKLALISNKLVSDIEKQGVVERKTFVIKFPKLREDLIPHFIRGYFDGDGSVYLAHDTREKYHDNIFLGIDICGTNEFLHDMQKYLPSVKENNIYKENRKTTDCWNIKLVSNIRCLEIYHYLYKDCDDLYLSRKREKFENFIKEKGSETTITNPTNNKDYLKLCYLED